MTSSIGGEANVSARHRESIGFPNGWLGIDGNGWPFVVRPGCDDRELLAIFFAEARTVWSDGGEQLVDDGDDSIEVAGPMFALPEVGQRTSRAWMVDHPLVHVVVTGGKDDGCSSTFSDTEVALPGSGIAVEIMGIAELGSIDEYGCDRHVARSATRLNASRVTVVQRTHGRHKSHTNLWSEGCSPGKSRIDGVEDDHRQWNECWSSGQE